MNALPAVPPSLLLAPLLGHSKGARSISALPTKMPGRLAESAAGPAARLLLLLAEMEAGSMNTRT
jgi:hypothetical protein